MKPNQTKGLVKELKILEIRGQVNYSNYKTGRNTEKSPGDLRRLAVTDILTINKRWWEKLSNEYKDNNNNNNNKESKAAQNNAISTHYIKTRIDKRQQNSKRRLCGERDETICYIISECSKLAQKEYKTRLDRVGKLIHW